MRKSILLLAAFCFSSVATYGATTADLADGAPDRYVVVPGDTLWGIAGRFLKDPWKWGEIWNLNREQIRNPNRIYPGDVIVLDRSGSEAQLKLLKNETVKLSPLVHAETLQAAPIPVIPSADIE